MIDQVRSVERVSLRGLTIAEVGFFSRWPNSSTVEATRTQGLSPREDLFCCRLEDLTREATEGAFKRDY